MLSSLAYQSVGLELDWVRDLNRNATPPDLTLLLDLPVDQALQRVREAGRGGERYEDRDLLEQIRLNYQRIASTLVAEGQRLEVVDASLPVHELHQRIVAAAARLIEECCVE